jgi:hypothetical protein
MKKVFTHIVALMVLGMYLFSYQILLAQITNTGTPPTTQNGVTEDYVVLSPLPGTTKGNCDTASGTSGQSGCKTDLQTYLPGLFKVFIGVGAIIAFLSITWAGFNYMFSDKLGKVADARKQLENTAYGTIMLIFSWTILNTIDPNLLSLNLNITRPNISSTQVTVTTNPGGGTTTTGAQTPATPANWGTDEAAIRSVLSNAGYDINRTNACAQPTDVQCTSVSTMPESVQLTLIQLKKDCTACGRLMITGGTEIGVHDAGGNHRPGGNAVDLAPTSALNAFLGYPNPVAGQKGSIVINGKTVTFQYEVAGQNNGGSVSTGNHWHLNL